MFHNETEHVVGDSLIHVRTHTVSLHMDKSATGWLDWTAVVDVAAVVEVMVTVVVIRIGRFQDIF